MEESSDVTTEESHTEAARAAGDSPSILPNGWEIKGFEEALTSSQERPPWVIEDLLMEQSATLVSAHPHSMKSLTFLYACVEAVAKQQVWGHFSAPDIRNSLFIETEDPAWLVESRIRGFAKGLGLGEPSSLPGFHYACPGPFDLLREQDSIHELVTRFGLNLIVISTLQNLLAGRDWRSQEDMQPVMAAIIRIARRCPVVLITHSPWDKKQRRAAGTVTQTANFLTTLHYEKITKKKDKATYVHARVDSKVGALDTDFSLRLLTDGDPRDPSSVRKIVYVGTGRPLGTLKDAILALYKEVPGATVKEIAEQAGCSERHVQKVLGAAGKAPKGKNRK